MAGKFANELDWFVTHMGSLRRMLPLYAATSSKLAVKFKEDLDTLVRDKAENKIYTSEGDLEQFKIKPEDYEKYRRLRSHLDDAAIFAGLLPRMAIVSLVSIYDAYLGKLIRVILDVKPEILNGSARQITFSELNSYRSIEDARDRLAELEVESVLRASHSEQFDWLENKLGLQLRKGLACWPHFIEVTERRNLFVHADGVANSQYISVCKKAGVPSDALCESGARLAVAPDYFKSASQCVTEIGVKLGQVIWRKLVPGELAEADDSLISTTYDLLVKREYKVVEEILVFATSEPVKHASAREKLYLTFNLAISMKAQGKKDECYALVNSIDLSPLSEIFKLAAAALREDFEEASRLMRKIGPAARPSKHEYENWPLFQWFRKSPQFEQAFNDVFGEPYGVVRPKDETAEVKPVPAISSEGSGQSDASGTQDDDKVIQ